MTFIFLKYPVRSILREKSQSVLSTLGLAAAISCSILILLYNKYEISFDRFNKNFDSIARVRTKMAGDFSYMGNDFFAKTPGGLEAALEKDIPGIERATKLHITSHIVEYNKSLFNERGFLYADPDFLEIFTFPVISGDPEAIMNEPFAIFLTERVARKYFGSENPIGKTFRVNQEFTYTVRGLLRDIPDNSHLSFDFLAGLETYRRVRSNGDSRIEGWSDFDFYTYLQLSENITIDDINGSMQNLPGKYLDDKPQFKGLQWIAQPLKSIHLGGNANFEPGSNSDVKYLYLISSVGIFILLIAIFNYMNMIAAMSFSRVKEIGMKKVVGNSRAGIILQLVSESVLLSFAGFLLALLVVWFVLPYFADFTDRPLTFRMIFELATFSMIVGLVVIVGALSALSTGFRLSSCKPLDLIRGVFRSSGGQGRDSRVRSILVVLQYFISIVALVSTLTILRQLNFIRKKDIGFEKDNIINIFIRDPQIKSKPDILISELRKNLNISAVTASSHIPCSISSAGKGFWQGKPEDVNQIVYRMGIDTDFLDFYNLRIVDGRGYSMDFMSDTLDSYILNQTAARLMGSGSAVGKEFGFNPVSQGRVVGVISDFNFQSLNFPVEPLAIMLLGNSEFRTSDIISVKVNDGRLAEARLFVEDLLKELSPGYINSVSVLDDRIDNMYKNDRRLASMVLFATVLALVLTCLGQYSLSSFTTRKRTREMAIRKVNGAGRNTILRLLAGEVTKLIAIALLFASPLSFFLMSEWLQNFATRIKLGPLVFFMSGLLILLISLAVIGYSMIKLSRVNPAQQIRHE